MPFKSLPRVPVVYPMPLLLGGFYLLGLIYFGLHPFNYARVYWHYLVAGLPALPPWLLQDSPDRLALSALLGVPLGLLFAAGLVGGSSRWRRAAGSLLVWLLLSLVGVGVVLLQLFFPQAALPRLQLFALSAGIATGVLVWLATGSGVRTALAGLDPLRLAGRLGESSGVRRLALAASAWALWLATGSWGLDSGASLQDWLAAPSAWAWPMGVLGLLWAATVHQRVPGAAPPWRQLFGLWLSLGVSGLVLEALHLTLAHGTPAWQHALLAQQAGLLSGIALAGVGHALIRGSRGRDLPGTGIPRPVMVAVVAVTLAVLLVLLPASGDQSLASVLKGVAPYSLVGSLESAGQNVYQAIKIAMLWLPLALMFAFVARGGALLGWAAALVAGFALLCLPWVPDWPARLWFEQAAAVSGIFAGLWLAERFPVAVTPRSAPTPRPMERAVPAAVPWPVAAGPVGADEVAAAGSVASSVAGAWRMRDADPAAPATAQPAFRARTRAPRMATETMPEPTRAGSAEAAESELPTGAASSFRSREAGSRSLPRATGAQAGAAADDTGPNAGPNAGPLPTARAQRDGRDRSNRALVPSPASIGQWLQRGLALAVLAAVVAAVMDFPRWPLPIGAGLAGYALLLWRYPLAALGVIPALLPVLDLAPWTGRFYLDEFDLLLLVTLAMLLWHGWLGRARLPLARPVAVTLSLVVLSWTIAMGIGLFPLAALDGNAFSNYWSHYNALRVYKGLLAALLLLLLLSRGLALDRAALERWLLPGLWLGLAMVAVVGVREHGLFAGLFALDAPYRITAGFSSMHTGGGHIEAYLVLAIPFLWLWPRRSHHPLWLVLGAAVLLAATYVTLVTVSRGGVAGLTLGLGLLALAALRSRQGAGHAQLAALSVAIVVIVALLAVAFGFSGGGYLSARMGQVERDFNIRWNHWSSALEMRPDGIATRLFGAGLGRFPDAYLHSAQARTEPSLHRFEREQGSSYLRLNAGETLYLAQRVLSAPATAYRLTVTARGFAHGDKLDVPLCEKQLLDSHECRWNSVNLTSPGDWQYFERRLNSGPVGAGPWWWSRPVELALFNPRKGAVVDVLEVALYGPDGDNLLANGDFSAAGDYWFFKTHDHLPWHLKNLWVALLFEQGWFGLLVFIALLVLVLVPLARRMWAGDPLAGVLLAAIAGFLVVGLVGSLFDAPRLTALLFMLLFLAALSGRSDAPGQQS